MPRRSIAEFRPTDWWLRPFYAAHQIEEILKEVGPLSEGRMRADGSGFERFMMRHVLAARLNSAARYYLFNSEWQVAPTKNQLAERYLKIEAAARALLDTLGASGGDPDAMPDWLLLGWPPGPLSADLRAAARIQQWAQDRRKWALEWVKEGPKLPSSHAADEALDEFVCSMAGIWRELFGRQHWRTVNRDRNGNRRDGGPFARFVLAALKPLRPNDMPTEQQTADRIKKLVRMGKLAS